MNNSSELSLYGLFRLRNVPPGFAICLFSDTDGKVYAQKSNEDGRITGFAPVHIEGSIIFPAPQGEEIVAKVGEPMLYGFHLTDGTFSIGPREAVETAVRSDIPNLRPTPFVWEEAASFVRDEEQRQLAEEETARLLKRRK